MRTGVKALVAFVIAWLATRGIKVPADVEAILITAITMLLSAGIHWLETRKGEGQGAKLARSLAQLFMLGLSGRPPTYPPKAPAGLEPKNYVG